MIIVDNFFKGQHENNAIFGHKGEINLHMQIILNAHFLHTCLFTI